MTIPIPLRPPVPARPYERAYWIQNGESPDAALAEPLATETSAQVAIIGGGLTGLWTALRMRELAPDCDIAILEADFCGAGASGRNGGQLHTWFASLEYLQARVGSAEAIELARSSRDVIAELAQMQDSGTIDMDLRLDGWIAGVSAATHLGGFEEINRICAEHGESPFREMSAQEYRDRTGHDAGFPATIEDYSGSIDPYKLVRGLRRTLIEQGVRIYEHTPVLTIERKGGVCLETPHGRLVAQSVLVATNAWAGSIPEINRIMYAVDAQVIATEPIPERLDAIGFSDGVSVSDSQLQVLYWQRTVDGRVLLGQGTGVPVYADRIGAKSNRDPRLVAGVVAEFRRLYPSLTDVSIDYDWVGTVDISASHLPMIGTLRTFPEVRYCVGWTGTALAQIPVVARMLAAQLLGVDNEWSAKRLANIRKHPMVFPEPLRYLGAQAVRRAVVRQVRKEKAGEPVDKITKALISLMPRYRGPLHTRNEES